MLFSRKDLVKIILPLMLQQLFTVSIGMIDSMMVSSAGEAAVSGVSLVTSLDLLLTYVFTALATGGAVVISQAIGQKNDQLIKESTKQLLYSVTAVATLVTAIVVALRMPILNALFGDADPQILMHAKGYFLYTALSFPLLGIYNAAGAAFRSIGNSMLFLWGSVVINIVKLICNAIFIIGLDMGAAGAGISTLIGRVFGAAFIVAFLFDKKYPICVEKIFRYKPDFRIIKSILRIGIPNGIENGMFQFGKLMTQSLISGFDLASNAANSVANTLVSFQYMPGNAINTAAIPIIGRCVGAADIKQAKRYSRLLLGIAYATLGLVVAVMLIMLKPAVASYSLSPEGAAATRDLVIIHSLFAIAIWPLGFVLPNIFRAASDVKFSLVVSASSMWIFRVGLGYLLALESISFFGLFSIPGAGMGVKGVWIAMMVDWIFRVVLYVIHYLRGSWLKKYKQL